MNYLMNPIENATWNKLVEWGMILSEFPPFPEKSVNWYELYKLYCVKIYQSDFNYLKNNVEEINDIMDQNISTYCDIIANLFALICYFSSDTKILSWYNEYFGMHNNNCLFEFGAKNDSIFKFECNNFLSITLRKKRKSLDVIKYLVETCGINYEYQYNEEEEEEENDNDPYIHNCLDIMIKQYDSEYGYDLEIIKYFIKTCNYPITEGMLECILFESNCDVTLIEFLIKEKKYCFDIDSLVTKIYEFFHTRIDDVFIDKIVYILNNIEVDNTDKIIIDMVLVGFDYDIKKMVKLAKAVKGSKNEKIISDLYNDISISLNNKDLLFESICRIDTNPFELKYKDFIKHADKFLCTKNHFDSYLEELRKKYTYSNDLTIHLTIHLTTRLTDYSDNSQNKLLFLHNSIPYYGNKKRVYDQILIFKDNDSIYHDETPIILDGNMKKYLINIYIDTILKNGLIDLMNINPTDIYDFLKFIEQYPATCLSVQSLETQLIKYSNIHGIVLCDKFKAMFDRCNLKLLYLYVNHNKIYEELCNDNKNKKNMSCKK